MQKTKVALAFSLMPDSPLEKVIEWTREAEDMGYAAVFMAEDRPLRMSTFRPMPRFQATSSNRLFHFVPVQTHRASDFGQESDKHL